MLKRLYTAADQEAFFREHIPDEILRGLSEAVVKGYRHARQHLDEGGYGDHERHDLGPHMRRAAVEKHLFDYAGKNPVSIQAVHERNQARNCFHIEARVGQVVITESMVSGPMCPIRDALFRRTLASSAQLNIFEPLDTSVTPDMALWAALIHGAVPADAPAPGFLQLVFPLPSGDHGLGINLLQEFPDLIAAGAHVPVETIDEQPRIAVRPEVRPLPDEEDNA